MSIEIPTVVHIRWNCLQPQLAPRNSLLMILTKISTRLFQSSNSSQTVTNGVEVHPLGFFTNCGKIRFYC
ncbi:hypothetical protein HanXRQr2_Chr17g0826321 [Helianthus annuus]|uniref:Uncharacterized protein n=1 Tax=Helianthus annuus TaxID=4232 RepID=A0A251RUC9_HELAN|nr:hypothetical protein HanXRQr2_Chr17g0826321 [Helianthus annuus]